LLVPLFDAEFYKEFHAKLRRCSYYGLACIVLGVRTKFIISILKYVYFNFLSNFRLAVWVLLELFRILIRRPHST
jgi:hypothetical protein